MKLGLDTNNVDKRKIRKKLSIFIGLCLLIISISSAAMGNWIPSHGKWRWVGEILVGIFGKYGYISFEFVLGVFLVFLGLTMKGDERK
ncbi:hypothetical protein FACS1894116_00610 [Betaproteobacteria bacterium]|nr:hypothetical protein FACS1894116_00610 [Betaproteobacteria bacterium]GHU28399.1 hypothetical protein FACS189497_03770 [Betaproteobacteria bacterium]